MLQVALFIVKLFKIPLQWLGVDYPQFEILMRIKLTMDFRSSPTGFQTSSRKKRTFIYQLFTYSMLGLLFGVAAFSIGDLVLSLTIFFSIIMVSLTMTLLSEFTSVLFDQRDNYILLPRPVSHRTLHDAQRSAPEGTSGTGPHWGHRQRPLEQGTCSTILLPLFHHPVNE